MSSSTGGEQPGAEVSDRWAAWRRDVDLEAYDARWDRLAAAGQTVHGEAELIASLAPGPTLDAGCGTGRVAIELARRGIEVVGVDLDADMIALARRKAPQLSWVVADLATMQLGRRFETAVMAGNVMLFARPADHDRIVGTLARHLVPGGRLVNGCTVEPDGLDLDTYDGMCRSHGLALDARWATWDRHPFVPGGGYHVSVHRRTTDGGTDPSPRDVHHGGGDPPVRRTSYSVGVDALARPADRPGLSRDRVVDTALAIVDREGLDALTMRRLASELGVEAMSLYHWFPNKAAILQALVEAAIRQTAARLDPSRETGWRANLRALALAYREVLLAHPNTLACTGGRPGRSVEAMRFIERMLDVMRADGFSPVEAVRAMMSVLAYISGAVTAEITRSAAPEPVESLLERFPLEEFPRVHEVAAIFRGPPPADEAVFIFGLDALLDGMSLRLEARADA